MIGYYDSIKDEYERQISFLMTTIGLSYNDIMIMPIRIGHDIIKKNSDNIISETIFQYRIHGIEPTNVKTMGTDYYKNYIDKQKLKRDKELLKQYDTEKSTEDEFKKKMEELKNG